MGAEGRVSPYAWPMNCRCSHDRKHLSEHVQISPSRGSPLKLKCPRWRTPAARIEFAPQSGHFADSASFSAAMKAAGLEVWSMKNSDVLKGWELSVTQLLEG